MYENKCYVLGDGSISGVDLDRFHPNLQQQDKLRRELDIDPKKIVVLFLGRINKDKGIYDLVCALNVCKSKSSIHFIMVGPDENNYLKKIIKKINKFNIDFSYAGTTLEPEKYYAGADFLCFPSHREGFGLTVIEAAACQIPTIGSDIYGLRDAIRHGETGILFDRGNIKELAAAIDKLSQDTDFRLKLGENARRYTLQKFEQSIVTNSLLDFYQFFINKHNNNFFRRKILHIASLRYTLNLFVKPFENFFSHKGYDFIYLSDQDILKQPKKKLQLNRGRLALIDILKSFKILLNIIREKPDVIHFHTPSSALSLFIILKILKRFDILLVYTSRGDFKESEIRTRRILFDYFDPVKWQIWDRVGVVNKSLYSKALKYHGQEKVQYLNLGAASPNIGKDTEPAIELVDWRKRGSIDLCWVGRFDKDKNLSEFIDLIDLLNLNCSLPVRGHVVGMQLQGDKFRSSKTPQFINFYGWLSNPQELISKCDFLISTSLREGFGMLPLEAGFVATPTLGYSNSGTSISIPAAGGFLFEKHAYKEISIFLKEWAQLDSKEHQKMRKHSHEKTLQYLKSFNLEDEMLELYKNLVAN